MSSWLRRLASTSSKTSRRTALPCCNNVHRRRLHARQELPYPIEDGLGDFLPPKALHTIAVDWQDGLLSRLNEQVRGIPELENLSVVQTIINTAADRQYTLAFNYASLALNNSFFLQNLKPPKDRPDHEHEISLPFANLIRTEFGDLDQLKSNIGAAATGMTSSGWVFLVTDGQNHLGVMSTFGPGTLLVRSRTPMFKYTSMAEQMHDISTAKTRVPSDDNPIPTSGSAYWEMSNHLSDRQSTLYRQNKIPPKSSGRNDEKIGQRLYPLFCVCVYEHAWMSADYGVWGMEDYLRRYWTVLDWAKVSNAFHQFNPGVPIY